MGSPAQGGPAGLPADEVRDRRALLCASSRAHPRTHLPFPLFLLDFYRSGKQFFPFKPQGTAAVNPLQHPEPCSALLAAPLHTALQAPHGTGRLLSTPLSQTGPARGGPQPPALRSPSFSASPPELGRGPSGRTPPGERPVSRHDPRPTGPSELSWAPGTREGPPPQGSPDPAAPAQLEPPWEATQDSPRRARPRLTQRAGPTAAPAPWKVRLTLSLSGTPGGCRACARVRHRVPAGGQSLGRWRGHGGSVPGADGEHRPGRGSHSPEHTASAHRPASPSAPGHPRRTNGCRGTCDLGEPHTPGPLGDARRRQRAARAPGRDHSNTGSAGPSESTSGSRAPGPWGRSFSCVRANCVSLSVVCPSSSSH